MNSGVTWRWLVIPAGVGSLMLLWHCLILYLRCSAAALSGCKLGLRLANRVQLFDSERLAACRSRDARRISGSLKLSETHIVWYSEIPWRTCRSPDVVVQLAHALARPGHHTVRGQWIGAGASSQGRMGEGCAGLS